ncbi:MAG: carboxypeptidase regulatory-like domain-containing protein [Acidobacteriaceae bacterium]|nr:carboxypeptidase regulatory-like domain-containing protein [Acidobacteriaceae bacterium]
MQKGLLARTLSRLGLTIALCLAMTIPALAQSDVGTVSGFIRDQTGAVVPGAKITIRNEGTGEEHVVNSDSQGHYTIPNLQPGYYGLAAESQGFKKFESTHNKLDPSSALALDANLSVGQATETVEVSATASALQTESAAVQTNVTSRQIQAQELNGRNPLYMASLVPGIRSGSTLGDFNFSLTNGGYSINGARSQDTLITMDGAPAVRTRANGTGIAVPNVDATQEIEVLTADYDAEYGRAAGGQIRIVTKSGTTDFHGALFEYFRNSDLNANTWQRNLSKSTNFASPFRYNDFGFDIGGPMWSPGLPKSMRQKLFFFVAEEWTRYRFTDTQTQAVPTALMREGNFSELLSPNPFYKGITQLYYPGTCPKLGAPTCQPIPGNVIPANFLSPNGMAILNAYPMPTPGFQQGTQNWIAQAAHPINQRKGTLNGDFLLNDNNHIAFRRTDFGYFEYQPFDQGSGLTGKYFKRPNQTNTLSWTSTISPTMVNEARVTVSLDDVYIPVNTSLLGFNRQNMNPPITYPYIFGGKDITGKIPTVNVPTFYGLAGGPYPSHSSGPIYTASDSLTKVAGNHTFKFGFSFEYSGENDEDQINVNTVPGGSNNQNGTFTFTDTGTGATSGVGLANLATGYADSYTEIGPRAYTAWRGQMYEAFAQDSWQVTPKLHINYGVRETTIVPFYALWGNADYFNGSLYNPAQAVQVDPKTGNVILGTGNPYNGVVIPGFSQFPSSAQGRVLAASQPVCDGASCTSLFDPSISKSYVHVTNQFQPRLGIAYQMDSKTVIRAGGGRFLTRMGLLDNIFPGGNSPFQPFVTVTNVKVDNPGASLKPGIAAPLTMTTLNPNLNPPESWNWNFTVERELFWKTLLSVAYVGHRGLHAWDVYDINQPQVGSVQANPGVATNALRPYRGFAAIQEEESGVNSTYNALQISWSRRFAQGSTFSFAYTLSKSMDNSSNYRDIVPDTYNTSNLWGPSEYDSRQMAVITYTYVLPFFKNQSNLSGKLLGGWSITGIAQFQTGTPCGIGTNNDYAGVGEFGSFGCGSQGQYWVLNGTPTVTGGFAGPTGNASSAKYFTANVTPPPAGSFNLQQGVRDSVYGPGFQNWNLGLFKTFQVNERSGFEFRAEAFDFINHPNWNTPNFNPTSSQFGEVTSKTNLARNLQLSLRYNF